MKILTPSVMADLSQTSFEDALQLFRQHTDYSSIATLLATREYLNEGLCSWLWFSHRWLCIGYIPKELLLHDNGWALQGVDVTVVHKGF